MIVINSLAPGRFGYNFRLLIFKKTHVKDKYLDYSCEIVPRWMPQDLTNYGSGDGLVPSGNKPLSYFPEQMLTQTYVAKYI